MFVTSCHMFSGPNKLLDTSPFPYPYEACSCMLAGIYSILTLVVSAEPQLKSSNLVHFGYHMLSSISSINSFGQHGKSPCFLAKATISIGATRQSSAWLTGPGRGAALHRAAQLFGPWGSILDGAFRI